MMMRMQVILPEGRVRAKNAQPCPVLYLLHGLSDNETVWTRRTSIERYAEEKGIAVVMPTTHRGWYTDAIAGLRYYTHIAQEVPAVAQALFPISNKREDNFIAGLSMGGYGAMKIALRNPGQFAAVATLSGVMDISERFRDWLAAEQIVEFERIFGPLGKVKGTENDLFHLVDKGLKEKKKMPKIFQCCGTEDFLYAANIRLREHVKNLPLDYTYREGPGAHSWGYWDTMIQEVLAWLPIGAAAKRTRTAAPVRKRKA